MFSDGVLDLIDLGVFTHQHKVQHPGKLVTSFAMGTKRLYDFVDDNPGVAFFDCSYVNDPGTIRMNSNTHAINSCIEVDITGQVCSDSIGTRMYSGMLDYFHQLQSKPSKLNLQHITDRNRWTNGFYEGIYAQ